MGFRPGPGSVGPGRSARDRVDILVVHSNPDAVRQIVAVLASQDQHVSSAGGVSEALPILAAAHIDVLVAECQELENNGAPLFHFLSSSARPPLIVPTTWTHRPEKQSHDVGLETERLRALITQVQTLLAQHDGDALRVGDLLVDMRLRRVTFRGQPISLPPIQFRLLTYLMQNAGRAVSARELLKAVWGYEDDEGEARELVKVHVRQLRRHLGLDSQHADYVQAVRGFGYLVTAPEEKQSL